MRRSVTALALVAALALVGAPAGSVTETTTPPGPDGVATAEPADDPTTLPPIDPSLLAQAARDGQAAASVIRARISELADARLAAASDEADHARVALDAAASRLVSEYAAIREEGEVLDRLQFSHREVLADYSDARTTLADRVAYLYTRNPELIISGDLLRTGELSEATSRRTMIRAVLAVDRQRLVEAYVAAVAVPDLTDRAGDLRDRAEASSTLLSAEAVAREVYAMRRDSLDDLAALPRDWLFPVAGEDHRFTDTFLAPRMEGTADAHRHQGADIFAPMGTAVVAVERGVVGRVGQVSLGGLRVWLLGETGASYYYAHLSGFADGIAPGTFVEAGTVLGYVGNTGNARFTPPHLHFQVHPDGGVAVNPTPLLRQTADRDASAAG